jgi:hypothetical protein
MDHDEDFPICRFLRNPLWDDANWSATTFAWHPTSEAPPVMGLLFDNGAAAEKLFTGLAADYNHSDRFEELRISIIEGSMTPDQPHGYSVHLCPDPEALAAQATVDGVVLSDRPIQRASRWNRMYPIPGSLPLLENFKREFQKHGEFLLAPVQRTPDGALQMMVKLGIVKNCIQFRMLSDIKDDRDIDMPAVLLPMLITSQK